MNKAKSLKQGWALKVMWLIVFLFGFSWAYMAYVLIDINRYLDGFIPGFIAGAVGVIGTSICCLTLQYASRRIRLARKVKRFYQGK
ncbi:hypothetical protein LCGC14_0884400 [marine sediment metagenome]|uniref:Uncharacterized protein n=1 Tax=marine sediment metagenome TaxID=412755 RepID=A0A0F9P107_9ZZZZ